MSSRRLSRPIEEYVAKGPEVTPDGANRPGIIVGDSLPSQDLRLLSQEYEGIVCERIAPHFAKASIWLWISALLSFLNVTLRQDRQASRASCR